MPDAGTGGFISQYPSGRYSKAHYHASGAVLVCLRGKGVTFNWPVDLGPRPWENGKGDQVKVADYVAGGLVAAAPGGGNWFHQHFSVGADPLRVINYWGGPTGRWGIAEETEDDVKAGNIFGIEEGGRTIHYPSEDPYIRELLPGEAARGRRRVHDEREALGTRLAKTLVREIRYLGGGFCTGKSLSVSEGVGA